MKSDMQIATELLEKCKKHLENEEKLKVEDSLLNSMWMESIEKGEENTQLYTKMDEVSRELQKEREEFDLYVRLLVKYLIKLELL
ncbi:MAG: hypothetical protein IKL08_02720 [Clostridia bacterium]|nr:hypothetical protein [Clostridia bacterium]